MDVIVKQKLYSSWDVSVFEKHEADLSDVWRALDGDLGVLAEAVDVLEVVVLEHALPHRVVLLTLLLTRRLLLVVLQGANSTCCWQFVGNAMQYGKNCHETNIRGL